MSDPTTPTEETPLLVVMQQLLNKLIDVSKQDKVPPGLAAISANRFRHQLTKIYGKESDELRSFPLLLISVAPDQIRTELQWRAAQGKRIVDSIRSLPESAQTPLLGKRIFIGHGRSPVWRELKDFVSDRLKLPWDEFNREPVAGYATSERLHAMMDQAAFAFLIMTAEEEHADGTVHARMNVVHEVGLFQGKLGLRKAIVLLEDGCSEFSNIVGLSQIRFPRGDIAARFEEIRRVLEREGLV